jgi:hypothetical protein
MQDRHYLSSLDQEGRTLGYMADVRSSLTDTTISRVGLSSEDHTTAITRYLRRAPSGVSSPAFQFGTLETNGPRSAPPGLPIEPRHLARSCSGAGRLGESTRLATGGSRSFQRLAVVVQR